MQDISKEMAIAFWEAAQEIVRTRVKEGQSVRISAEAYQQLEEAFYKYTAWQVTEPKAEVVVNG